MSLDVALYQYVLSIATLSQLGGRVFPLLAPPTAPMPYLIYSEVAYEEVGHMLGVEEVHRAAYQLDVYAHSHKEARELANTLRYALQVWRDMQATPAIVHAVIGRRETEPVPRDNGGALMDYRVSTDVDIWASDAQPALA